MVMGTTSCVAPNLISTTEDTTCVNGTADLSATPETGMTVTWYDAPTNGNLLGTGNSFTTPALTTTTNYYAKAAQISSVSGGKAEPTPTPTSSTGTTNFGLIFNVMQAITIEKVTVYPVSSTNASGNLTIDVIDANNNIVATGTYPVTGSPLPSVSPVILDLDFQIPPGVNYKMRPRTFTGISGLAFDPAANTPTSGVYPYPYNLGTAATILTSANVAAPTNTPRYEMYYYFYNWQVESKCESSAVTVTANVDQTCSALSVQDEVVKNNDFEVYPNPFSDFIKISNSREIESLSFVDMAGRVIKVVNSPSAEVHLQDLKSGMYILKMNFKDGTFKTVKIIKK